VLSTTRTRLVPRSSATYVQVTGCSGSRHHSERRRATPHTTDHLPRHTDHETLRSMPREALVHYLQQQLLVVSSLT